MQMLRLRNNLGGFTLVELLIAMAILAILSTIALSSFNSSQMRGRDVQRKSDLKQIANALEMYYSDYGLYPSFSANGLIIACPAPSTNCNWGDQTAMSDAKGVMYMRTIPQDPKGTNYYYRTLDSGKKFQIFAHLENTQDKNCIDGNCSVDVTGGANCGSGICNFAVFSSNSKADETP